MHEAVWLRQNNRAAVFLFDDSHSCDSKVEKKTINGESVHKPLAKMGRMWGNMQSLVQGTALQINGVQQLVIAFTRQSAENLDLSGPCSLDSLHAGQLGVQAHDLCRFQYMLQTYRWVPNRYAPEFPDTMKISLIIVSY